MDELATRRAMRELEDREIKERGCETVSFCTLDGHTFTMAYHPDSEITAELIETLQALMDKQQRGEL